MSPGRPNRLDRADPISYIQTARGQIVPLFLRFLGHPGWPRRCRIQGNTRFTLCLSCETRSGMSPGGCSLLDYSGFPWHGRPRRNKGTGSRPGPTSNSRDQTWRPGACPLIPWASRGTSSRPESPTVARGGPANPKSRRLRTDPLVWANLLASVGSALEPQGPSRNRTEPVLNIRRLAHEKWGQAPGRHAGPSSHEVGAGREPVPIFLRL